MSNEWIVQAEITVQVSEDSWIRQSKQMKITPATTMAQIENWLAAYDLDKNSVRLLPLSNPQP